MSGVIAELERWIRDTPDAPALWANGAVTTYRELGERTGRLAALLRERGVGPERCVAVIADRGVPQIVGVLAALRAGGAYVPIKPDLPAERIEQMLAETAPAVILRDDATPVDTPALRAAADVPGDALAYVIYTSGSTGRPKGVMITRRNFEAQLAWNHRALPRGPRDRFLQLHAFTFDASVSEIFWPLLVGGMLVLPRASGELDASYLGGLIAETGVTVIHLVPAMIEVLGEIAPERTASVELLIAGGEALTPEVARRCMRSFPRAALLNTYGPTETTVNATFAHVRDGAPITIGRAIDDTTAYVLDASLAPVPAGGIGELWLGGVQVARGYLQRPGLTAERFAPDPFIGRPGARMYRTGDRVRMTPDGELEFVGRVDRQIKLRGFRIELEEIETVLQSHPDVRAAAVVVHEAASGDRSLVAYASGACDAASLRAFLAARLPAHMVPSTFVVLAELPRTPGGKLDRNALPPPAAPELQPAAQVAPTTETEQVLAAIWCKVLGVEQVGVTENFFDLGGHSLLVARLVARISSKLGVEIPPAEIFNHPTIAEQAAHVEQLARAGHGDDSTERELAATIAAMSDAAVARELTRWSQVALAPVPPPAPTTLEGARRWLFEVWLAQDAIDARPSQPLARWTAASAPATLFQRINWEFHERGNFPSLGIQTSALALHGPLAIPALERAVASLVERHPALRTTFALDAETRTLVQTVQSRGATLELLRADDADGAQALFAEAGRPHDLARAPIRVQLVRIAADEHVLFVVPHHIVIDGMAWDVLDSELAALYRAHATGVDPELSPLTMRFTDFAHWQTTLEQRPVGTRQLAFWERVVAGYEPLELPGDRGGAPGRGAIGLALDTYTFGAHPFVVDGERFAAIERLCTRMRCTPYSVVATAFLLLLARCADRADACLMSGNMHRNRPGSEDVIGCFVQPYPLRVAFDDAATLDEAVRRCHEAVLAHRAHSYVAPSSTLDTWREWSRYNLNYLVDSTPRGAQTGDRARSTLDFGAVAAQRLDWRAFPMQTPHDLALFLLQDPTGIRGRLVFNADRFSPELAARVAVRLGRLLDLLAAGGSERVGDLPRAP